jgi:hypothetical protein
VAALVTDKIITGEVIWAGVGEEAWDEEKIPPHPDPLPQGKRGLIGKTEEAIARKNLRGVTRKIKDGIFRGRPGAGGIF